MGRELRNVPPNWEHPKKKRLDSFRRRYEDRYMPMRDRTVQRAWDEWQAEYAEWLAGEHDKIIAEYGDEKYPKAEPYRAFCAWHGAPPDPTYYRPDWPVETMTWYQVYETVSEGTPVTPPFATREELVDYLATHGDFWDQKRRAEGDNLMPCAPWSRAAAHAFVFGDGWAPSMVITRASDGTATIATPGHEAQPVAPTEEDDRDG